MSDSILDNTKKMLGIEASYTAFDIDVIIHINTVFTTLVQLGIGPATGFMIMDNSKTWQDFLGVDLNLNSVKTYMFLKVRLAFDPPGTPYHISALNEQIKELEWRLNVHRETTQWVDPMPYPLAGNPMGDRVVLDGGIG